MFGDTAINSKTSYKDLVDDDEVMSITLTADYTDTQAPTISGVTDGEIYCGAQIVTVSDNEGVESVTVNDVPVTLTDGKFTLNPAEGEQTIVATDAAGNVSAQITVTVYSSHVGGTATCKEKATCEHCGQKYGEVDSTNHTSLIHVPAKEATTEDEGNIEYWYCEGCGKYFGDEGCSNDITLDDTVIEKLPLPPTGDNSHMALWFILLFISAAIIVMRRKKIMM